MRGRAAPGGRNPFVEGGGGGSPMEAEGGDTDGRWMCMLCGKGLGDEADRADEVETGRGRDPTRAAPVGDLRCADKVAGSNSVERGAAGMAWWS